jgi:hypothetical protein
MAGVPAILEAGCPIKLVLLGWGFWFHVTVVPAAAGEKK